MQEDRLYCRIISDLVSKHYFSRLDVEKEEGSQGLGWRLQEESPD
jgi:hypothetical protein